MKKIYIETLGCSKNQVDTETMLGILDDAYLLAETPEEAEIIIVNTCSFIHDAQDESVETILAFASLKTAGICEKLIVTGCLSQRFPEALLSEIPAVDAIVGTGNFYKILEVVKALEDGTDQRVFIESVDLTIPENLPRILTSPSHYAYIKIAEGCDNRCTYCIIPQLRGKYRSREIADIVSEVEDFVSYGVREIILIAQDTSRYGVDLYGESKLDELLTKLNAIESLKWIRVQYSYPDILDDRLLEGFFKNEKVVNYFDIPIQHASNAVLKRMNRRTSLEALMTLIEKIRGRDENAVIRTTIIVGFPGETEEDFKTLLDFVSATKFDRLGAFTYSNEEGTAAYRLPDQVDEAVKEDRKDRLMAKQMVISEQLSLSKIGKTFEVVVEEIAEEGKILVGRSAYDSPEIDGVVYIHTTLPLAMGSFVKVYITDALEYDLIGVIADEHCQ
ncbi:30S ribosomal protein S12 methylthiotransferase RimO [Fusibacter paucivorans]|uniref:Ribosomal protein uS12 methylthiotransferase RimO n=1 Tax=Fusibacter paucivorans TaxID=76009 RepID=A0ABS5PSV8_9FIRM|nr:30S ribosomal protein S12 methylthiotransferase RimO [Fusibacter paucivorans]MBS7527997.1 30S ribosomal protein S12 methylthiotransferase RimO [Fusibacter paucivorans]